MASELWRPLARLLHRTVPAWLVRGLGGLMVAAGMSVPWVGEALGWWAHGGGELVESVNTNTGNVAVKQLAGGSQDTEMCTGGATLDTLFVELNEVTTRIKSRFTEVDDWSDVFYEIEPQANSAGTPQTQSAMFYTLAQASESLLLDKAKAMLYYQTAFKRDRTNLEALESARKIYQQMANLEMVTKLMSLEVRANGDPSRAPSLNYAYGRALLNLRNIDQARPYLEAAAGAEHSNQEFKDRFQEIQYVRGNWQFELQMRINQLITLTGQSDPLTAGVENDGDLLSALYLRTARILQQEAPNDPRLLSLLFKALDADPRNDEAGYIAETILAAGGYLQHIQKLQDRRAALEKDPAQKVSLLRQFGIVWLVRFNNADMAAYFFRQALEYAYDIGGTSLKDEVEGDWHLGALYLVKKYAERTGHSDGLIELAERGLQVIPDPIDAALVAVLVGEIAWKLRDDIDNARKLLTYGAAKAPCHPTVVAFVAQFGAL